MVRLAFFTAVVVYSTLAVGCTALAEAHRAYSDENVIVVKEHKTYWQKAEEFNAKHLEKEH